MSIITSGGGQAAQAKLDSLSLLKNLANSVVAKSENDASDFEFDIIEKLVSWLQNPTAAMESPEEKADIEKLVDLLVARETATPLAEEAAKKEL